MKTVIDSAILKDFFLTQPKQVPLGDTKEINCWNSFWTFMQSETDLSIHNHKENNNYNNPYFQFYKQLTIGRGYTKIAHNNFVKPVECEFNIDNPHTFYCLIEEDENEQIKYRRRNGLLIGFMNDYKKYWLDLKLLNKSINLPVRKNYDGKIFKSWDELEDYLLPFTDVVIADNYLLNNPKKAEDNFKRILLKLDKATPVKYNLTVITYEGKDYPESNPPEYKLIAKDEYQKLSLFIEKNHLKCELSFVLTTGSIKEHDRGIFMNYLWIDSGDSFNYFGSQNEIITRGTKIYFNTLASSDNFNSAKAALDNLSAIIKKMKNKNPWIYAIGSLRNRLLNIEKLPSKIIKKNLRDTIQNSHANLAPQDMQ